MRLEAQAVFTVVSGASRTLQFLLPYMALRFLAWGLSVFLSTPEEPMRARIEARCVYRPCVFWVAHDSFTTFGARDFRDLNEFNGFKVLSFAGEQKHER